MTRMLRRSLTVLAPCLLLVNACAFGHASMPPPAPPAPPSVHQPGGTPGWSSDEEGPAPMATAGLTTESAPAVRSSKVARPGERVRLAMKEDADQNVSAAATAPDAPRADKTQKLVVSGAVEVSVDNVPAAAAAVRAEALRRGALIVSDKVRGARYGVSAVLQLRLPPAEVDPLVGWLAQQGTVESSTLEGTDVSREYFDQELRLHTLRVTLERLEKLLANRENVALNDVLAVEREMTRVRGDIERLEGEHRFLADRVERATLDVHLTTRAEHVAHAPEQSFVISAHGTALRFLDDGNRARNRLGAGVRILFGRRFDLTLDAFPARKNDAGGNDRSILFGVGGALYSDFLGGGRRRFGNPFLGLRLGAGSMNNRSTITYAAEAGVELVRLKYLLVDVTGRALGLYYNKKPTGADIAFQATLSIGVPF